jgi:hypothetical protein
MKIDHVQLGTILAALRLWQSELEKRRVPYDDEIATDGGAFPALTVDEIDLLCEELNCTDDPRYTAAALEEVKPDHLTFIRTIAFMTKDGEEDNNGDTFTMENDDAYDSVHSLISQARVLLNDIPGHIAPQYE